MMMRMRRFWRVTFSVFSHYPFSGHSHVDSKDDEFDDEFDDDFDDFDDFDDDFDSKDDEF